MTKPNKELLNIQLASILSESPYSDRKLCLFFIHDFDFNANGLCIPEELCSANNPVTNKPFYDSLNGAPLVASLKGDDLGGHEPEFDEDGNIIRLNTEGIGTLFNTHIGTHQINGEDKYGLWAEGFLWLRFANTLNVIEELYTEHGRVDTSCEVSLGGFEFSEQGRTAIKSILYFGHCLLGSTKSPAYADSGMHEFNLQVAEAYEKDTKTNPGINSSLNINEQNGGVRMLSHEEIRQQLGALINPNDNESGNWEVIYCTWDLVVFDDFCVAREYETGRLYRFDYKVNDDGATISLIGERRLQIVQYVDAPEDEEVQISELFMKFKELEEKIKTLNSEMEQKNSQINTLTEEKTQIESAKETEINGLKTEIETLQKEVSTKEESLQMSETESNEKIIKLGELVEDLKVQINNLAPIKEEFDKVQAEIKAKEIAEKQKELKQYALNSNLIEEKELNENEDIKKMIEELNESGIKALIADRIVEKAKIKTNDRNKNGDVVITFNTEGEELIPQSKKEKLYAVRV